MTDTVVQRKYKERQCFLLAYVSPQRSTTDDTHIAKALEDDEGGDATGGRVGGSGNRSEKSERWLRKGSSKFASLGELEFDMVRASVLQVEDV